MGWACQALLQRYFSGEFIGSYAAIPHNATIFAICGQVLLQFVQLPMALLWFSGAVPHAWGHLFVNVAPRGLNPSAFVAVPNDQRSSPCGDR